MSDTVIIPYTQLARERADATPPGATFHVSPRYSPGSPAMVNLDTALDVAAWETIFWRDHKDGILGPGKKSLAEEMGLSGIVWARWEKRNSIFKLDLLTGVLTTGEIV